MSAATAEPSPRMSSAAESHPHAHRQLVNRIVVSSAFAKSERLCTLLTYVCEMTFKGRDAEINEQKIGHAVFGRSLDYDSSVDGIVRTQASRLRQRLELYFQQEGMDEPVRLVIPRGGYVPIFQPRTTAPQLPMPEVAAPAPEPALVPLPSPLEFESGEQQRGRPVLAWVLCGLLLLVLAWVLIRDHSRRQAAVSKAAPHPLWSQMFSPEHPTLEVPADSGLVLYHSYEQRSVSLNDYLRGTYRSPAAAGSPHVLPSPMEDQRIDFTNRRYTSIVDLEAATKLTQMAQAAHSTMQVRYARDLRPNDLKSGNVILMGAFEANPWVELFERNMNFVLKNDYRAHVFSVINRSPHPGEAARWDSAKADPQQRVYGVVTFTSNLSGNGNALLIEGTSMAGTEAAWDFVSDDTELLPFLKRIQRADGTVPHFEVLVGTQNMSASAVHDSLLAWRITN